MQLAQQCTAATISFIPIVGPSFYRHSKQCSDMHLMEKSQRNFTCRSPTSRKQTSSVSEQAAIPHLKRLGLAIRVVPSTVDAAGPVLNAVRRFISPASTIQQTTKTKSTGDRSRNSLQLRDEPCCISRDNSQVSDLSHRTAPTLQVDNGRPLVCWSRAVTNSCIIVQGCSIATRAMLAT